MPATERTDDSTAADSPAAERTATGLAAILSGAGVLHFVAPRFFDAMIPSWVPGSPRGWTYGSGVAELAVAAALVNPATRRRGGLAAAALFAGVFPANVQMAVDAFRAGRPAPWRAALLARLPLQVPLVTSALRVGRDG